MSSPRTRPSQLVIIGNFLGPWAFICADDSRFLTKHVIHPLSPPPSSRLTGPLSFTLQIQWRLSNLRINKVSGRWPYSSFPSTHQFSSCIMLDLIRDSTVGNILNHFSNGRILPYPDQKPGYRIPERYLARSPASGSSPSTRVPTPSPEDSEKKAKSPAASIRVSVDTIAPEYQKGVDPATLEAGIAKAETRSSTESVPVDTFLVDWDGDDDQENPQ